ncbi:hypothetical protein [Collimonas sp. OK242]|jgi:hypothetical protein|uniref:hypothetical protein n=1 Tax=Collimonas sp. OK242 TaxID=1798195 RepID=UPI000B874650|nr:hypothetical protein [Collimonas sp. OK242]
MKYLTLAVLIAAASMPVLNNAAAKSAQYTMQSDVDTMLIGTVIAQTVFIVLIVLCRKQAFIVLLSMFAWGLR